MARYRVRRQSYIGGRVYEVGEKVEYDGHPADNLEPLDAAGREAAAKAKEHFAAERAAMQLQGNPEAAAMGAAVVNELEKRELTKGGKRMDTGPGLGLDEPKLPGADLTGEASARGRSKS
jgi:sRNA-binding protein